MTKKMSQVMELMSSFRNMSSKCNSFDLSESYSQMKSIMEKENLNMQDYLKQIDNWNGASNMSVPSETSGEKLSSVVNSFVRKFYTDNLKNNDERFQLLMWNENYYPSFLIDNKKISWEHKNYLLHLAAKLCKLVYNEDSGNENIQKAARGSSVGIELLEEAYRHGNDDSRFYWSNWNLIFSLSALYIMEKFGLYVDHFDKVLAKNTQNLKNIVNAYQ